MRRLPDGSLTLNDTTARLCRFCDSPAVVWEYPATQTTLARWNVGALTAWPACDPCAALIEADDRHGLQARAIRAVHPHWPEQPLAPEVYLVAITYTEELHGEFFRRRIGARRAVMPREPSTY